MGRAKGVVDIEVLALAEPIHERGIVGLFAGIEAQVLDHHDVAFAHALRQAQRLESGHFR